MSTKEQVLDAVQKMSPEATIDEILDELIFIKKVQTGISQSEKGVTFTTDEAKEKLARWLK
ncbi:MAG: hypothetical protein IAE93_04395 [Ignavibacteria bacterium]|nr:hypothetical protein [Ignavibacteria bacterium]